jgi:uncharacterized protein YjdB
MSSNPSVATVDSNGNVKGISKGTVKIIVIAKDGSASAVALITVKEEPVIISDVPSGTGEVVPRQGLIISPKEATIDVNEIMTLILETIPFEATDKAVNWSSSNPSIVEVNESGVITGKSYGTATVTAVSQDGAHSATCLVTVAKPSKEVIDPPGDPGNPFDNDLVIKLLIVFGFILLIVIAIIIYSKYKKQKESESNS